MMRLHTKIREVAENVFVFSVPKTIVTRMNAVVFKARQHAVATNAPPPNSMNKYGFEVHDPAMRMLQEKFVEPFARLIYRKRLKTRPYAFTVDYFVDKQRSLAAHFDTSDVTLNLCLGKVWEGGDLVIYDKAGKRPVLKIKQRVGQAIVHLGSRVHRAKPITRGWRTNLILWCVVRK